MMKFIGFVLAIFLAVATANNLPPWLLQKTTTPAPVVEEDGIIIDLRSKKNELHMKCPKRNEDSKHAQWYRKFRDNRIKELLKKGNKVRFPSNSEIIIENLSSKDEGLYYCKRSFKNSKKPITIKLFRVAIIDPKDFEEETLPPNSARKPVWTIVPKYVKRVDSNLQIYLPCRAEGKNVKVTAYRLKNGKIFRKFPGRGVSIWKTELEHSGAYKCVAENEAGKIEHVFNLVVQVHGGYSEWTEWGSCDKSCGWGVKTRKKECNNPKPANGGRYCSSRDITVERVACRTRLCSRPKLTKFGYEITDKELIVHCHAKGVPTPRIQWKIDGGRLSSFYNYQSPTMKIPIVMARSGSYSCTVRNDVGYFFTMYITIEL